MKIFETFWVLNYIQGRLPKSFEDLEWHCCWVCWNLKTVALFEPICTYTHLLFEQFHHHCAVPFHRVIVEKLCFGNHRDFWFHTALQQTEFSSSQAQKTCHNNCGGWERSPEIGWPDKWQSKGTAGSGSKSSSTGGAPLTRTTTISSFPTHRALCPGWNATS